MKRLLIVFIVSTFLLMTGAAYADPPGFIPPGHQYGKGGDGDTTATAIGVGVGIANVENNISNRVTTSQFLSNCIKTSTTQGQFQGQAITAPLTNSVLISYPEEKRELPVFPTYQAPMMGEHRGPYEKGVYGTMAPWSTQIIWTKTDIDQYPRGGTVVMAETGLAKTENFKLIGKPAPAEGYVIRDILVEGEKGDSPLHLWGTGAEAAMNNGAMAVFPADFKCGFATKGSGWNVGLGGGFSAVGGGDDNYGGSVGGGTGYGQYYTTPVEKCTLYLQMVADKNNTKK